MVKETTMTITLELTPETEAKLTLEASARGLSLDAFLQSIITTQAAALELAKPDPALSSDIDEIFDTVQIPPGVGEGAMTRENWYR
jgi:hypothetical protein